MNTANVKNYLTALQERIVNALETFDGKPFLRDEWDRGISCVIEEGNFFGRGGVNFSHVTGDQMPGSATAHRPELAGRRFKAMGVSLVLHPRSPYCPTAHMNVRFFAAHPVGDEELVWWFGGGCSLHSEEAIVRLLSVLLADSHRTPTRAKRVGGK